MNSIFIVGLVPLFSSFFYGIFFFSVLHFDTDGAFFAGFGSRRNILYIGIERSPVFETARIMLNKDLFYFGDTFFTENTIEECGCPL